MTTKINYVTEGDFKGKDVVSSLGQLMIMKGAFSSLKINKDTVEQIKVLSSDLSESKEKIYSISILFKTKEKSTIAVDVEMYEKIISLFPQSDSNKLEEFLNDGWKIIGYSAVLLGSGMTTGIVKAAMGSMEKHYILLQKGKEVRTYCTIVDGKGEEIGHSDIIFA